jgi:hypothetical protein
MFLAGVNASTRYSKWPVFSCPLMAGFGCPPRPEVAEAAALYASIGLFHYTFRRRFLATADFVRQKISWRMFIENSDQSRELWRNSHLRFPQQIRILIHLSTPQVARLDKSVTRLKCR